MPIAPKAFKSYPSRKHPSASKAGYGRDWQRFRDWFASVVPPVCGAKLNGNDTEFSCGKSFVSREMHLDHLIPFDSIDDPLRLDADNVVWRCRSCHSRKTATNDGGFGNQR